MTDSIKVKLNQQNNIKYFYNTRRFLVWASFLGLLSIGIIVLSIVPQISSTSNLYSEMLKENKRLAQLRIKVAQLDDASNSTIFVNSDKINLTLPSKKPLLELLSGLNNIGNKTQVSFADISLTPGKISTESGETAASAKKKEANTGAKKYEVLDLDVTVTGKIQNINQFLKEAELLAPFTNVTAMTLNERTTSGQVTSFADTLFEAKLTITTYFFNRAITANIDTSLPELTAAQQTVINGIQNFTYTTIETQNEIKGGGLENLFPNVNSLPDAVDF